MTANEALKGLELLRQEVPQHLIGKLPRVTCGDCRKNNCQRHQKSKCQVCGGWLGQHMHLEYVGHAETTAQLLEADRSWNWEPLAFDANGLPAFDADGGLWIKLTVCGVTRLGYGTADNANGFKARGDIRKEIIGDALRNAAMRFGWALNLWAKTDIHEHTPQEDSEPSRPAQRSNGHAPETDPWATAAPATTTSPAPEQPAGQNGSPKANTSLLKAVNVALGKHGLSGDARFPKLAELVSRPIASSSDLTVDEARTVLAALAKQAEAEAAAGPPPDWTAEKAEQLAADFLIELQGARTDEQRVEIGGRIGAAVKARKITKEDRDTLLAAYNGAQKQPTGANA